jgi:UDP-galactopyranose mutase
MPRSVYQQFVKGYTEKQWGVAATSLESALARRFEVRHDGDIRLSKHKYQGLPIDGYHFWMQKMLAGIPVFLEHDYLSERDVYRARKMLIFTGPIDEYFGYKYGRLRYRGQKRLHRYFTDVQQYQPGVQVNYPDIDTGPHIRIIEWKHLMPAGSRIFKGTLTTNETPYDPLDPNDFEYPFPDCTNRAVYNLYKAEVVKQDRLLICGRLGEYRYLDMDQAIGRALHLSKDL